MVELDLVIPVYNEGSNIHRVLNALAEGVSTSFRVLICYDFEEDDTLVALRDYESEKVNLELVKNPGRGPHAAVLAGFSASEAPGVLVYPADDDYNAGRLDAMVDQLRAGCDVVCASRFIPGGDMVGCPWLKSVLVRSAAFTLFHLARLPTRDATNGFRMFSRRVLNEIEIESCEGFTYSLELLVKAHRLGWRVGEVPVQWFERGSGQGKSRFKVLNWLIPYLRWYVYAFATTLLRRGPDTVSRRH